jgi:short-subunit dehydrogenase
MAEINGKVVWITGASSGIGEALAYALAENNCKIIISARREAELNRVKANCRFPDLVRVLPLDLANQQEVEQAATKAIALFGHIDVLVNNGGISQRGLAKETVSDVYRLLMEVDYFGTIFLTKSLIPHFLERQQGHFVTVTSITGIASTPYRSGYAAAKHALHGFFNALRAELWKDCKHIKVTLICPGWTNTNLSLTALTADGSAQNKKDDTHAKGLPASHVARVIVMAIKKEKREVYVGGFKEVAAAYLQRYWPGLFARIVRVAKVK